MNRLLNATAAIEGATGAGLLLVPGLVVRLLLGAEISGLAFPLARIAGAALLALAIACWLASTDARAAAWVILPAMAFYNLAAAIVLGVAGVQTSTTVVLWLAVLLHMGMGACCAARLSRKNDDRERSKPLSL
jgi:hypothetical protein